MKINEIRALPPVTATGDQPGGDLADTVRRAVERAGDSGGDSGQWIDIPVIMPELEPLDDSDDALPMPGGMTFTTRVRLDGGAA